MSCRCEVLGADGQWRAAPAVAAGEVFRLFGADGRLVADEDGVRRWRALTASVVGPDGEIACDTEQVPETDAEREVRTLGAYWPGSQAPRIERESLGPPRRLR